MNREDIIRLAQEAGMLATERYGDIEGYTRFAALVAAHEREEIIAEFEKRHEGIKHRNNYFLVSANYVRSRT